MGNTKRHFIIFFQCRSEKKYTYGNYTTEHLNYPSRKECCEYIVSQNNGNFELNQVVITNVIELSKIDLDNWNN